MEPQGKPLYHLCSFSLNIQSVVFCCLSQTLIAIYKESANDEFPVPKGDLLRYDEYPILDKTHSTALWRIIVNSCFLNLCKDLAQIKDQDLEN